MYVETLVMITVKKRYKLICTKIYLKSNYIESKMEEDIDLKNQYRFKKLPDPVSTREPASKTYADNLFDDPSVLKNTTHIDLNDRNITLR